MASKVLLPTLSEDGWMDTSVKTADYLLSHFFESDYSQTYLYNGEVASLAWIIQDKQGDVSDAIRAVQITLSAYFNRYFNNTVVEVNDVTDIASPSKGALSIFLKYTDTDNKDFVVSKIVEYDNTTSFRVVSINNGPEVL